MATKDQGVVPFRPFGTQRFLIGEIFRGLSEGVHEFVILKSRQVGASTVLWIFDAFWALMPPGGLQGMIAADSDDNKEFARDVFGETVRSIPTKWQPRGGVKVHNRTMLRFGNDSRLMYQVAGVRDSGGRSRLGRSRGVSFLHGTEVAFWSDDAPIKALRGSVSERNPRRLYLWETTANGFNFFHTMWNLAGKAVTQRAIFVPWWMHELYQVPRDSKIFSVYYRDGRLTPEERAWQREITAEWHVELTPQQWAWYRFKRAEGMEDSQEAMHQEFPTLPRHAFQASGSGYVGAVAMARLREMLREQPEATTYRYEWAPQIEGSILVQTHANQGSLTCWEEPEPNAHYVVSCDPAPGGGGGDNACVQVWRATRNKLVQVAEFASNDTGLTHTAWVIAHLAGIYAPAHLICEMQGGGWGVFEELGRLRDWGWGTARRAEIQNILGGIQHYIYRRPDSMSGGGYWQWQTTGQTQPRIMQRLRDVLLHGQLEIRSGELVQELASVRQEQVQGFARYYSEGTAHDDRVLAAAMAVEMWTSQVVPYLAYQPPVTQAEADALGAEAPHAGERALRGIFSRILS